MAEIINFPGRVGIGENWHAPKAIILERIPNRYHPRLSEIWAAHKGDDTPHLSRRGEQELARLAKSPSQLIAIIGTYERDGIRSESLLGHYAMNDRDTSFEFCFDRSFLPQMGLHKLAIKYRLYTAALSLVFGGRDRDIVPCYASIYENNVPSIGNYTALGAVEVVALPECIRCEDDVSVPVEGPPIRFLVFTPDAILSSFEDMLEILRTGSLRLGSHEVGITMRNGDLAAPEIAQEMLTEVKQMCLLQERYARRKYGMS